MLSHQLQKNTLDGPKQIIQNPPEGQGIKEIKFEEGEAYAINLLVSTGEGKSRLRNTKTTVYSKNPGVNYMLKLKTSRAVLSEITTKFGNMAFSLQHMEDPKKARMGISECQTHQLVQNYDVLEEKAEGAIVAHCLFTVLLMPSGPLKITSGPAFDADIVKSEKAIADESIIDLLKQSVRSTNKKKKKKVWGFFFDEWIFVWWLNPLSPSLPIRLLLVVVMMARMENRRIDHFLIVSD